MQNASWGTSPAPIQPRGYRTDDAAAYLGVSPALVRKLTAVGSLACSRLGVAVVYLKDDLDELLSANRGTR